MNKYGGDIGEDVIIFNLTRIGNQIYKLLPLREEGKDWEKPMQTLMIEIAGAGSLFPQLPHMLSLECKLEGMLTSKSDDFMLFRRCIFECCGLVDRVKANVNGYA